MYSRQSAVVLLHNIYTKTLVTETNENNLVISKRLYNFINSVY